MWSLQRTRSLSGLPASSRLQVPRQFRCTRANPFSRPPRPVVNGESALPEDDIAEVKANAAIKPENSKVTRKNLVSHALDENFGTEELMEELNDRSEFGKRGEAVLVAQLAVIFLVMFPPMRLQGIVYLGGVLALIAGAAMCLYAFVCLGRSWSPFVRPRRSNVLVTTGMYQYMRHPLYSGIILLAFGLAAVTYSETRLVLAWLLLQVLNYKASQEEAAMLERHGAAYQSYVDRVHRFYPSF